MTQIVSFKDVQGHWDAAARTWDNPQFVYIGRANRAYRLPESPFANPTQVKLQAGETEAQARRRAIAAYRDHLRQRPDLLRRLHLLRGKTLVCWCKDADHPDRQCHGDVLLEYLGETNAEAIPGIGQGTLADGQKPVLAWDNGQAAYGIGMTQRGVLYRTDTRSENVFGEPGKVYTTWIEWYRDYLKGVLRVRGNAVCSGMSRTEYARFVYETRLKDWEARTDERGMMECEILRELLAELEGE